MVKFYRLKKNSLKKLKIKKISIHPIKYIEKYGKFYVYKLFF